MLFSTGPVPTGQTLNAGTTIGPAEQPAPSLIRPVLLTRNIEDIRLGQRVVGRNPLREQTQTPSAITPESWREVRLTTGDPRGTKHELAFLRPLDWIDAVGAVPGREIHMHLPEMGLDGPALVESIHPCPPIEPDDNRVDEARMLVTGTMRHLADDVLQISITGLDEPLGVTATHPIWSETRHDFIPASQLQVGEELRSETGVLAQVTTITPHRGPPQHVYNLEIDGEHVYQVGADGLLVHNDCYDEALAKLNITTSSTSTAPSFVYTIYNEAGDLHKFGVSDAAGNRLRQSLAEAGEGMTHTTTGVMPKYQAHMTEKYFRSLHYNSTGQWELPGMQVPYPIDFATGLPIPKPE